MNSTHPSSDNQTDEAAVDQPFGSRASLQGEALPVRSRPHERFGEQGLGLPTYGGLGTRADPGEQARGVTGWFDPTLGSTDDLPAARRSHAGRGPKGYVRSDESVLEEVCQRLTDHEAIDATDIEVSVNQGEVTLRGTVEDLASKQAAEEVASSVTGVREVDNRLRRRRPEQGA